MLHMYSKICLIFLLLTIVFADELHLRKAEETVDLVNSTGNEYVGELQRLELDKLEDPDLPDYNGYGNWSYEASDGVSGIINKFTISEHRKRYPNIKRAVCPTCTCGLKNSGRIVGGSEISKNEFPWLALLRVGDTFYCGATLINDQFVVTSLYCSYYPVNQMTVVLLVFIRNRPINDEIFRQVSVVYRPTYPFKTINRNIALLKLSETVSIGTLPLRPACLPTSRTRTFSGLTGVAVGWGIATLNLNRLTSFPYKVLLKISTRPTCMKHTSTPGVATNYVMCAGSLAGGNGYCLYDEGGSFTVRVNGKHTLVGVMSKAASNGGPNSLDIFTRVNRFLPFIHDIADGSCYCTE